MATRLFHVSEEADISVFHPRTPSRLDVDKVTRLVWAINERCLPNYLTPRDCPRVTYHVGECTAQADRAAFFSSSAATHAVVVEHGWFDALCRTTLYVYEFDPAGFVLQDDVAGYYVSTQIQIPISRTVVDNIPAALFARGVELRVVDSLWDIAERVKASTLNWSLCRMANAAGTPAFYRPAF